MGSVTWSGTLRSMRASCPAQPRPPVSAAVTSEWMTSHTAALGTLAGSSLWMYASHAAHCAGRSVSIARVPGRMVMRTPGCRMIEWRRDVGISTMSEQSVYR